MATERFYQKCLREELAGRLEKNPRYSLRSFARSLGLDPSTLSRILSGSKIPTPALSRKILSQLSLDPQDEKAFLHSMAKAYEDKGVQRKKPEVRSLLRDALPEILERDLTPEVFRVISDWYHYAILQLARTDRCPADPRRLARVFGIQEMEAKLAVERLIELEMLRVDGKRMRRTAERLTSGDPATTGPALRKRARQITERSLRSMEQDAINLRNHTTMTLLLDPDQMPHAKAMIQEFMDRLSENLPAKNPKVYELQVNLFPLQKSEV